MSPKWLVIWCIACGMFVFSACSPTALNEARQTVSQADSLWATGQMYGIDEGDSAMLAHAYETLGKYAAVPSLVHGTSSLGTYVHACYHYGRLLRAKDNPVAAMQVFINATHVGSDDKQILGRIYNNMGDICHRANEFSLSYDMFKRSAEVFLSDKDTLSYYYCLNDMAFEKAILADKQGTDSLISYIECNCTHPDVLRRIFETKAELSLRTQQYDSAIDYVNQLCEAGYNESTSILIKAQAYSYLSNKDSSVYYAEQVLKKSSDLSDMHNALYILTNDDDRKDVLAVRKTAADRSDLQKILRAQQGDFSQAVQLLEQNLNRKPDWRRYVIWALITISVLLFVIGLYVWKKRKQQLSSLSQKHAADIIESIKKHIDVTDLKTTLHWKDYEAMKSDADLYMGGLVTKLESYHLNEVEIRFCILTLLDFPLKKIAETIHYSYPSAIKTLKKRIANKLSTTPSALKDFLLHMPPKA